MTPSSKPLIRAPSQSEIDDAQMFNSYLSHIPYATQPPTYQQATQDSNSYPVYTQSLPYNPSLASYWAGGTPIAYSPTTFIQPRADLVRPVRRRESMSRPNYLYAPYPYARQEPGDGVSQPASTSFAQAIDAFHPTLYSATNSDAADQLRLFCADAERRRETAEPESALTDQLLLRLPKPGAPRGSGSRQGVEAYRCLWPACGQEIRRKPNAIAHLLTHAGYKPFVCQECPHHPRFRYKHDYTRHCKNHIPVY